MENEVKVVHNSCLELSGHPSSAELPPIRLHLVGALGTSPSVLPLALCCLPTISAWPPSVCPMQGCGRWSQNIACSAMVLKSRAVAPLPRRWAERCRRNRAERQLSREMWQKVALGQGLEASASQPEWESDLLIQCPQQRHLT